MARINLTARVVQGIKAKAVRSEYFDENLPGFFLRVTPAGVKSYGIMYRHSGQLKRYTIGTTDQWELAAARDEARERIREAARGDDPAAKKKKGRVAETFGQLAEAFIDQYSKKRKRSWVEDKRIVDVYLKPLKPIKAGAVTRSDVRSIIEKIADQAPIMANRVFACIRKIYRWGIGQDIVAETPCFGLQAPGVEKSRNRVLSNDEIKKVWKAFEANSSDSTEVYKLRLLTAQRGGEVMGMRWDEVDLKTRWWTIPAERSKNKLPHRVWLSDPAIQIIDKARKKNLARTKKQGGPSPWVFPGQKKGQPLVETKRAKTLIAETAGLEQNWTGHDLRRTAATVMASSGTPRLILSRILNHADPEVTAVYDRAGYDAEKKEALDSWARKLMAIVSDLKIVPTKKAARSRPNSADARGRN